ncbi:MAG: site-specific integrase [Chlorobiaceae bacterium]
MGVSVREVGLKTGGVSFSVDVYYKGQRQQIKTDIRAEKTQGREYQTAKRTAEAKAIELEALLQVDPSAVFMSKEKRSSCFIEYFETIALKEKGNAPIYQNTLVHLRRFYGSSPLFMQYVSLVWAERFRAYLDSLEIKATTKANYLAALKIILNMAVKENLIADFTRKIKPFKKNDTLPKYLTLDQVKTLEATRCTNPAVKTAFLFSCVTGLRVSDVEQLRFSDLHQEGDRVTIRYKMKKTAQWQFLPLGGQAIKYLDKAKLIHAEMSGDQQGENAPVFPLPCRVTSSHTLSRWGQAAGIPFPLGWHCGRHSFAVLSLSMGTDLYTVSKLMGHKTIAMTQVYAKVLDQTKTAAMDKLPVW